MKNVQIIGMRVLQCGATALLFFQSARSLFVLIPLMLLGLYRERDAIRNRRSRRLEEHFRDGLQCLLASLEAGYSVENSIELAAEDLGRMLGEKEPIAVDFRKMARKLRSGSTAEQVIEEFGESSRVEDIRDFAGVFVIAKRTGGDIIRIVRAVTDTLYAKQEVYREIRTVLLAKEFEVGIMKVMPYLMLAYFLLFSPGFLKPLYAGFAGHMVMFVLYLTYRAFCLMAERMAQIEV